MSTQASPAYESRKSAHASARLRSGFAIVVVGTCLVATTMLLGSRVSEYYYLAAYTILQFIVLGTAWNILGGYGGYVNFGTAGFFAAGCYTTIVLNKLFHLPLLVDMSAAAAIAGLMGLGTGYLTLRLRGVFFSIATLAMAIVLQTIVINWSFVGGGRGVYVIRPANLRIIRFIRTSVGDAHDRSCDLRRVRSVGRGKVMDRYRTRGDQG